MLHAVPSDADHKDKMCQLYATAPKDREPGAPLCGVCDKYRWAHMLPDTVRAIKTCKLDKRECKTLLERYLPHIESCAA